MRSRRLPPVLCLAIAAVAGHAQAQDAPSGGSRRDIVVTGRTEEQAKRVRRAVSAITRPAANGGFETQYARWDQPVCVAVAGMPVDGARFVADRIGAVARAAGATAAQPGCAPNLMIVASNDPDAFLKRVLDERPAWFLRLNAAEIGTLQRDRAPVRWLSVTDVTSSQGDPTQPDGSGGHPFQTLPQWQGSNIQAATQTHLAQMLILVDGRATEGLSYGALADYLSMVALARLQPDTSAPMVDTILSLFPRGKADAPQALTDFDRAYLKALYSLDPGLHGTMQHLAMADRINRLMDAAADRDASTDAPQAARGAGAVDAQP